MKRRATPADARSNATRQRGVDTEIRNAIVTMERLLGSGRYADLETAAKQLAERHPGHGLVHYMLGLSYLARSQWYSAVDELEQAAGLLPPNAQLLDHLGIAQSFTGRTSLARENFRRSLSLDSKRVSALVNLSRLQNAYEEYEEAEQLARKALHFRPGFRQAKLSLAKALAGQSRAEEALTLLYGLEEAAPDDFDVLYEIGLIKRLLGDYAGSVDCLRRALAIRPQEHQVWSPYLFSLSNDDRASPDQVFDEHRRFGEAVEGSQRPHWGGWNRPPQADRTLNVGFLTAELRNHVVSYFLEAVFEALDKSQIRLHAYYNHPKKDEVTERLRHHFESWRDVVRLSDDDLAQSIRSDGVDILIDLSGHTEFNRLPVFARKPAPLSVTMLGYPNTTGLTAIDYRLLDTIAAPPAGRPKRFTERILTAPVITCFRNPIDAPDVSTAPALRNGYPTFASFNRIEKVGERTLTLWAAILAAVPDARLIIGYIPLGGVKEALIERLGSLGVARDRLSFQPRVPLSEYFAMHAEVDVLLDSFPYNGGTTTEHALWMGVPVVSLAGPGLPSRLGASILGRVGLADWVVDTDADYVARAVAAVSDLDKLSALRDTLRPRCKDGPLRQPAAAAHCLETALRRAWENWCEGSPPKRIDLEPDSVGIRLPPEIATSCRGAAAKGWQWEIAETR